MEDELKRERGTPPLGGLPPQTPCWGSAAPPNRPPTKINIEYPAISRRGQRHLCGSQIRINTRNTRIQKHIQNLESSRLKAIPEDKNMIQIWDSRVDPPLVAPVALFGGLWAICWLWAAARSDHIKYRPKASYALFYRLVYRT